MADYRSFDRDLPHGEISLLPYQSDKLAQLAVRAGCSVPDLLWLGLSPLTFSCSETWQPLIERFCEKAGYVWEWFPRPGEVVLTRVR